jgi:Restriction endonuclease NotI
MAVVIDEAFFESLIGLDAEKHLSNAEIAWFVVGYDHTPDGWQLKSRKVVYTRLDSSVKALTGGLPLSKEQFEQQLQSKLATAHPEHPLTKKPR